MRGHSKKLHKRKGGVRLPQSKRRVAGKSWIDEGGKRAVAFGGNVFRTKGGEKKRL